MQALLVTALKAVGPSLLAALRPALLQLATELITKAKAAQLPPEYKWAEPVLTAIENDLLRLLAV